MMLSVCSTPGDGGFWDEGQSFVTYRFGVLDKHLAPTHLVLVRVHVDRAQQVLHPLPLVPAPGRPRLRGEDGIAARRGDVSHGHTVGIPKLPSQWSLTVAGICGRVGGRRNLPGALGCSPSAPGTRLGASPCGAGRDTAGMAGGWGTCSVPLATEGPAQRCSFWMKTGLGRIPIAGSCPLGSFISPIHHEAPLLPALLPVPGFLGLVGLDAADVVWRALH